MKQIIISSIILLSYGCAHTMDHKDTTTHKKPKPIKTSKKKCKTLFSKSTKHVGVVVEKGCLLKDTITISFILFGDPKIAGRQAAFITKHLFPYSRLQLVMKTFITDDKMGTKYPMIIYKVIKP